jgi:hypothetical protein
VFSGFEYQICICLGEGEGGGVFRGCINESNNPTDGELSTPSFARCYDVAIPALLKRYARPRRNQIPMARNKGGAQTATSFQRSDPRTWDSSLSHACLQHNGRRSTFWGFGCRYGGSGVMVLGWLWGGYRAFGRKGTVCIPRLATALHGHT